MHIPGQLPWILAAVCRAQNVHGTVHAQPPLEMLLRVPTSGTVVCLLPPAPMLQRSATQAYGHRTPTGNRAIPRLVLVNDNAQFLVLSCF